MPFDYEAKLTAVYNSLINANTLTSGFDLSSGLTTRVKNVFKNDPAVTSIKSMDYPCVFVRIQNKEEEFGSLGTTGIAGNSKLGTCNYDVIGLYHKDGVIGLHSTVLNEVYKLAENIEGIFQNNLTLSDTAMWCNPKRTEFFGPFMSGGVFVKGVLVQLEARYFFR